MGVLKSSSKYRINLFTVNWCFIESDSYNFYFDPSHNDQLRSIWDGKIIGRQQCRTCWTLKTAQMYSNWQINFINNWKAFNFAFNGKWQKLLNVWIATLDLLRGRLLQIHRYMLPTAAVARWIDTVFGLQEFTEHQRMPRTTFITSIHRDWEILHYANIRSE